MSFTLLRLVGAPFAPCLALSIGAHAACPAPMATELLERFISADCEACWSARSIPKGTPFVLDWIVPSPRGDDAPLSAAALAEASGRAGGLPPEGTLQRRQALPPQPGLSLEVQDGPAWNGYVGLRLRVQREGAALRAAAVGYLALIENVPSGDDGTPIERRLVRALAGPLLLDDTHASTEHLLALRIPTGAKAQRLGAVGWVETPSGTVIGLAHAAVPDCAKSK